MRSKKSSSKLEENRNFEQMFINKMLISLCTLTIGLNSPQINISFTKINSPSCQLEPGHLFEIHQIEFCVSADKNQSKILKQNISDRIISELHLLKSLLIKTDYGSFDEKINSQIKQTNNQIIFNLQQTTMLILFETAVGYALFRCDKPKKLEKVQNITKLFENPEGVKKLLTLEDFHKFKSTADAFKCISKLMKGKIPKSLSKFLHKNIVEKEVGDNIAVADKKLGKLITENFGVTCKQNEGIEELMRVIRFNIANLLDIDNEEELKMMTLGVAHGLSRYKLKFSAQKVDIMIIQAVSLLDDLDKEINNYTMRLKQWYGWHFPQMAKIVSDNLIYTKVVKLTGMREKMGETDLSEILPEDIEKDVKDAAEISMGTEISETDEKHIIALCDQILELTDYRASLQEYLKNRMQALAPNLTALVGELVGARLICHAGSLVNLAKCPASTVQILGAEKALFKAIKTKHNTPKYGIIYQAQLISSTPTKNKGKVSRALAAKCSLCVRCDALGQSQNAEMGVEAREYIEKRIQYLESNEGLRQTRKPNQGKMGGKNNEGYSQRSEFVRRRPEQEGSQPMKRPKRN